MITKGNQEEQVLREADISPRAIKSIKIENKGKIMGRRHGLADLNLKGGVVLILPSNDKIFDLEYQVG